MPQINRRMELQKLLTKIIGNTNVYYQPPATVRMNYPCIVYKFSNIQTMRANNGIYLKKRKYSVTLIHKDPENTIVDEILENIQYSNLTSTFNSEGLYHYVFTIYF